MFNDDVLATCPECGSSDAAMTGEEINCNTCGFAEPLVIDAQKRAGMQKDLLQALNMAQARDVLQRWSFAG